MLQDARARYAVLKGSQPRRKRVSRRRYGSSGAELDGRTTRSAVERKKRAAALWRRERLVPLPQNRAVKAGRHDVSVVPATARLMIPPRRG